MEIVGYGDRLRAQPGETVGFKVSCRSAEFSTQLVRLIHTDRNPDGPGVKQELLDSAANGSYPGRVQEIHVGSYVTVPHHPALNLENGFTLLAWIYPTAPGRGTQAVLAKWRPSDSAGYGMVLDGEGSLGLWIGDGRDNQEEISTGEPMHARTWYFAVATYDPETETAALRQTPAVEWPQEHDAIAIGDHAYLRPAVNESPLLIGACQEKNPARHFNGKIDSPKIYNRVLSSEEIDLLFAGGTIADGLAASWDFGRDFATARITDVSPNQLHGTAVNLPTRAVTGRNWRGREINFQRAPEEYAAIHFHDDDLEDAGWETDFQYTVPEELPSGTYAFRLRAGTAEDHIPFFVRPRTGRPGARIALLMGTYTFLAYGNEHLAANPVLQEYLEAAGREVEFPKNPDEHYLMDNKLGGLYDLHSDGTGICYMSSRQPILNFRPGNLQRTLGQDGGPVLLNANLHQADWLETMGYEFDVITDEDLHEEGTDLLRPYRAVMSDAHPEYWTEAMLDGLEGYLTGGGRFMYMGGNGLYWVTSVDPQRPHIIEVRRWKGTGSWEAAPGESFHSSTGEPGGLWRNRGRAPNRLVGIGMTAQGGNGVNSAYRRTPDGYHPRAAFIFEGVEGEMIGDFPTLGLGWGAAGYEIDRMDFEAGTPRHALTVASAADFDDSFHHVVEEVMHMNSDQTGTTNPLVRADMVFFEYPNEGAVFSTGSIAWSACLSHNNYQNNVSKITDNVLRNFAADGPLPG